MASSKKPAKKGKTSKSRKRPPKNAPTLLVVKDFDNPCCPEGLEPAHTALTIVVEGVNHALEGPIHHDPISNTYVMQKKVIYSILTDYRVSVSAPSKFKLNNRLADVFVCDPKGNPVPWDEAMVDLQRRMHPPLVLPDVLADYPQHDITWEITGGSVAYDDNGTLMSVVLIVDEQGRILQQQLSATRSANGLLQLLLQGVVYPLSDDVAAGERYVPSALATDDETLLELLRDASEHLDVAIELRHADTPNAYPMLDKMYESLGVLKPFLSDVSHEALRDYFEAVHRYYKQAHWSRVRDDKFVGVQVDGGNWHYLNLMGQANEEPGLAFFVDWLAVCEAFNQNPSLSGIFTLLSLDNPDTPIEQEAISLWSLEELNPEDQAYVKALEKYQRYSIDGGFALPLRVGAEMVRPPQLGLEPYTLILSAIDTVLSRRSTSVVTSIKQTITLGDHKVLLRYPAKGDEALADTALGTYRLTISLNDDALDSAEFDDDDLDYSIAATIPDAPMDDSGTEKLDRVILEASGDSTAQDVINTLRKELTFFVGSVVTVPVVDPNDPYVPESVHLFSNVAHGPKPLIYQLAERAKREPLAFATWLSMYPVTFERISDSTRPKDDAVRVLEPYPEALGDVP